MVPVLSLIVILSTSVLVTKIATMALVHTGLSKTVAKFQARSAFTGSGFTTNETEMIMKHPVRRKIVLLLMLLGNVGIISVLASLVLTFVDDNMERNDWIIEMLVLGAGITLLWFLASSKMVDRWLSRMINRFLRRYTDLNVKDYASLLHLTSDYEISEIHAEKHQWITGEPLGKLQLRQEGINLIGIERKDGTFIGLPDADTVIQDGDLLIVFGLKKTIHSLLDRKKGVNATIEHNKAVKEHQQKQEEEQKAKEKTQ